ncbi:Mur ligase [Fragilariopsis cylindrus CCMP1102]|uniref:tetrahydrofolate synthase n=1 Tax=Fragilariopsis cylindrus CCMP1102 TaxID=635003 RepID=A0A1E7FYM2_9STRA|nr:Mur ligase [Fragilariopsis cylindrus CCMP1102]|eukprot:OEU23251.1 Mur ligase [Fragilariopsis cylindrus CCMP1102]
MKQSVAAIVGTNNNADNLAVSASHLYSYESAVNALLSPGLHQSITKEDILKSSLRRTKTVADMRYYWNKILKYNRHTNNVNTNDDDQKKNKKKPLLIHITGTKGKGSTACMCENILRSNGYKTGLFTSPHLINIRERIRYNGQPINEKLFSDVYWKIRQAFEVDESDETSDEEVDPPPKLPGYFRMLTLMGMYTFLYELSDDVDVIILEVGMGGRYDATNFLDTTNTTTTTTTAATTNSNNYCSYFQRVVYGVTLLDLDHTRILGTTLKQIAWEKGGIFSMNKLNPNGISSSTSSTTSTSKLLSEPKSNSKSTTTEKEETDDKDEPSSSTSSTSSSSSNKKYYILDRHDFRMVPPSVTLNALSSAKWPGRCQTLINKKKNVRFYLDGAHTPQSLDATVEWFRSKSNSSSSSNGTGIFNCSHERNPVELLELLLKHQSGFSRVYFAQSDTSRPSPIAKASAESLLKERGITIREELLADEGKKTDDDSEGEIEGKMNTKTTTWQETLAIIWKHLLIQSTADTKSASTSASALVSLSQTRDQDSKVFVTGSLYLVGSFLTALGWTEESSPTSPSPSSSSSSTLASTTIQ